MINVTKTFLPPQSEYGSILTRAWNSGWITNRGELVKELEERLKLRLGVSHVLAMTNGTLPIQIAIKALDLSGEIITTPFSYVATSSSIVWEDCTPIFVDIDPEHLTIDETKIEAAITSDTSAILATHVYGNPCHVEAIHTIAQKHELKVIYDAAHCFEVQFGGKSLFEYGDLSSCSFHATKLFHTGEGGALFTQSEELYNLLFSYHNFGHEGPEKIKHLGINAKMSELQAAMGLAVLPYMDEIISARKKIVETYQKGLGDLNLKFQKIRAGTRWNYSYFPVIFDSEAQLIKVQSALNVADIFPRRYFYPSLNTLPYVMPSSCPVAESIAERVTCLPLYHNLDIGDVQRIISIIKESL
ncbi:MAG: DegT/DnrJ/EryC1/StrS family aminotransferase [Flavobacteriaceae bacterium]|nr:DegT/DnrJ/EryC1/StrS family aminotransferase [Flavobacteriaceae bacterium]